MAGDSIGAAKPRRRRHPIAGLAPGTLTIDSEAPFPVVTVFAYNGDDLLERRIDDIDEIEPLFDQWPMVWVNVSGLGDEATIRGLGELFELHRLTLEDVVSVGQRPKVEEYDEFVYVVARMAPEKGQVETEQLSLIFGSGFVLTFQEKVGDHFSGVRERLRHGKGQIRKAGSDYLTYALLDAVIDAYFHPLEEIRDEIEAVDDEILGASDEEALHKIYWIKHRLLALRRVVGPHREAINALIRDCGEFVTAETAVYLRDCYDHVLRLTELVEVYREQCADLMNTYLSMVSNRMNEVMKVLTIIATIFIPLGFIAGLYGMNFDPEVSPWNMPELSWPFGYPLAIGVMAALAGAMLFFFWRKGWFE
jgi:magnesium transporter